VTATKPEPNGYPVAEGMPKETPKAAQAFACYIELGRERTVAKVATVLGIAGQRTRDWAVKYHWRDRAAIYDSRAMKNRFSEVNGERAEQHREAIRKFRVDQDRRAKAMGDLADLMVELTTEKITAMRAAGELPSEQQIANLAKTCATLAETSANLQATALGVDELVDMVDQELGE